MKMFAPATRKFATERASMQLHPEVLAEPCEMVKLRAAAQRTARAKRRLAARCKGSVRNLIQPLAALPLPLFFFRIPVFQPGLAKTTPQDLARVKDQSSLPPGSILLETNKLRVVVKAAVVLGQVLAGCGIHLHGL